MNSPIEPNLEEVKTYLESFIEEDIVKVCINVYDSRNGPRWSVSRICADESASFPPYGKTPFEHTTLKYAALNSKGKFIYKTATVTNIDSQTYIDF
jgi:hypothetical protein